MPTYCTLVYDGSKQPDHLQKVFRFKGVAFEHGKEETVNPELAGHLLSTCEKDSFKLVSGEPIAWVPGTASAKVAARRAAANAKTFNQDPAGALESVTALPAEMLKATVADVEGGKADARLGDLAVWAKLSGKVDLANAAARRAGAIRPKR